MHIFVFICIGLTGTLAAVHAKRDISILVKTIHSYTPYGLLIHRPSSSIKPLI